MMCLRLRLAIVLAAFSLVFLAPRADAQDGRPPRPAPPAPIEQAPSAPSFEPIGPPTSDAEPDPRLRREPTRLRDVMRVGSVFELGADDSAQDVVVVAGNAIISGRVERDLVVVLGDATITPSAVIKGSVSVTGGNVRVQEGAYIGRGLVVVGGELDAPAGLATRGDSFVLDTRGFGGRMLWLVDWLKRGLLWGRLIVPDLGWMWWFVAAWAFITLVAAQVLEAPARKAAAVLRQRPVSSVALGLATLVMAGPLSVLLAVSVIGALVVPFVLLAIVAAWTVGRIATMRWIGSSIVGEGEEETPKLVGLRSVSIGLVVIAVFYALPVLGLAAWAGFGVFGLGAAMLTFINAYRRENPLPMRRSVPPPVPPPSAPAHDSASPEDATMPTPTPIPVPLAVSAIPAEQRARGLVAFPHAMFLDRLAAAVLDLILILLITAFLDTDHFNVIFLLTLAYHVAFIAWKGTTVGGIILQLRVVRTDGTPVGGADALVRGLASVFSTVVLGLGFLWIVRDPERQAWHDRIAGTYVVKVPREWPI